MSIEALSLIITISFLFLSISLTFHLIINYSSRLGKCVSNHLYLRSVPYLIFIMMAVIFIWGVKNEALVLTPILLAINFTLGMLFLARFKSLVKEKHTWNGCQCSKCGLQRDEQHDLNPKDCTCQICGKTAHELIGCKCQRCGNLVHEKLAYNDCKCMRCGTEMHTFMGVKCFYCGKISPNHQHTFKFLEASRSGRVGSDLYKCEACGEIASGEEIGF